MMRRSRAPARSRASSTRWAVGAYLATSSSERMPRPKTVTPRARMCCRSALAASSSSEPPSEITMTRRWRSVPPVARSMPSSRIASSRARASFVPPLELSASPRSLAREASSFAAASGLTSTGSASNTMSAVRSRISRSIPRRRSSVSTSLATAASASMTTRAASAATGAT